MAGDPFGRRGDGEQILLQDRLERRQGQRQFTQITLVRLAPVGFALVVETLAQEKRLELLLGKSSTLDPSAACLTLLS